MANLKALSRMAGIARGMRKGAEDYRKIQAVKQKTEQSTAAFDLDMKMKNLSLDKAEMENRHAPERLLYAREKLKEQSKIRKGQIKMTGYKIKEAESEIQGNIKEGIQETKVLAKLINNEGDFFGGAKDLPPGSKIQTKIGDTTLSFEGKQGNIEGLTNAQIIQGQSLARKVAGVRGAKNIAPSIFEEMKAGKTVDEIEDALRFSGQSKQFTGAIRNAAQSVLINAPEKKGQLAMDFIDDLMASGDTEEAKRNIKRLARKQAGTAEEKAVNGKERTVKLLDEIKDDLEVLENSGVNTNIFSGTAEKVAERVGTVKEPGLRRVANKIAVAIQSYRRSMSGVAFSEPESQEYKSIFPSISKTAAFNTQNIESLQEVMQGDLDSFYSLSMGEGAYNELYSKGQAVEGEQGQAIQEGRIAVNKQTGERVIFKGGAWQPIE